MPVTIRRLFSLIGTAGVILVLSALAYLVNVQAQLLLCVNEKLHSNYPNPDTADVWAGCERLYRGFPLSFFR